MFVKRRPHATTGTIPHALDMFRNEVRFYREIAPVVGVRVPACAEAEESDEGFRLVLEDLRAWTPGGSPVEVARLLGSLHERWQGVAAARWPWLRPPGAAAGLIAALYDRTWPELEARRDLPRTVRALGATLVGRIEELERREGEAGPLTLVHGDAAARNVRTSVAGEIALVDWEDVRLAPAAVDLTWWLLTSVDPSDWDAVRRASSPAARAGEAGVLGAALAQALLSLAGMEDGSDDAAAAIVRIEAACTRWG